MSLRVAVFYTWVPGAEYDAITRAFLLSYLTYRPGVEHQLTMLVKADRVPPHLEALPVNAKWIAVGPGNFDIGPFTAQLATHREYDRMVLVGVYSRVLCDDWLGKLTAAGPLAGATGSMEVRPHLRTTALSICPRLLELMPARLTWSKDDCWNFEHGPDCLYERARHAGVAGVVVDRHGAVYHEQDWMSSGTFRAREQENLMVADNHTDIYAKADQDQRERLASLAWDRAEPVGLSSASPRPAYSLNGSG